MKQKQVTLIMVDDIGHLRVQYYDDPAKATLVGTEFIMKYGNRHCMCEGFFRPVDRKPRSRSSTG